MKAKPLTQSNIRRKCRPRKHHVDLSRFACPHCGKGDHLKVHSRYGKTEPRYRFRCTACGRTFTERLGTPLYRAQKRTKDVAQLATALVNGNGIRGAARVTGMDTKTVMAYLRRLGPHAAAVNDAQCRDLGTVELQVDEAWTYVTKKQHNLTRQDRRQRPEWGDVWLYLAKDAETKLIPAAMIGDRTQATTEQLVDDLAERFTPPFPLVTSDMMDHYADAFRPLLMDHPHLQYVQIKGGHGKEAQVVFGNRQIVRDILNASPVSTAPNTSFVENMFGSVRLGNRRMHRQVNGVSKKREMLAHQIALYSAWYNFCKTHASLRQALQNPNGKKWQPRTPAMAAGLTDRSWAVADLLTATT